MIRRPPRSTRTDTLFPYTTLFRSVVYLRSVPPVTGDDPPRVVTPADPSYRVGRAESGDRTGEKIFAGSCMGCHGWTGVSPVSRHATLTGVRSVNDPSAPNVAQVVLHGVHRDTPDGLLTSEERRVGHECASPCSSRWSPLR